MSNEELEQLLKSLHLDRILDILGDELARASKSHSTYKEFLARLLRAQPMTHRFF